VSHTLWAKAKRRSALYHLLCCSGWSHQLTRMHCPNWEESKKRQHSRRVWLSSRLKMGL